MASRQYQPVSGALVVVFLFMGAFAGEARACVQCNTIDGECATTLPHLTGNCECIIREKHGTLICKPSGVCDPSDPTTCGGGLPPKIALAPALKVNLSSLAFLRERHPLLEVALFAASDSTLLHDGAGSGTIKLLERLPAVDAPVGTVFAYDSQVRVFSSDLEGKHDSDWATFYIRLENTRTGEVAEYDGQLLKRGRQGSVTPRTDGVSAEVITWQAEE